MKTNTKTRTPKKILSVFLSILMLLSVVVVGNPFTASAASTVTWKASVSAKGLGPRYGGGYAGVGYNYDLFEDGFDIDRTGTHISHYGDEEIYGIHRNGLLYIYSVYDYNPQAQNYDTRVETNVPDRILVGKTFSMWDRGDEVYYYAGTHYDKVLRYNKDSGYCDPNASSTTYIRTENRFANSGYYDYLKKNYNYTFYRFDGKSPFPFSSDSWPLDEDGDPIGVHDIDPRNYSAHQTIFDIALDDDVSYTDSDDRFEVSSVSASYHFPGIITYPVNTSKVTEYYDLAISKYGKTNRYYTSDSWNRYINALNAAETIINNGVHLYIFEYGYLDARPENIADPQAQIYSVWTALRDAINGLVANPTAISYDNSVDGATVSGPATARPGNNISVTLRLEDSHSVSPNAGINISYADGTSKSFTNATRSGNVLTFNVPLEGFEPTVKAINIERNQYTVSIQESATGLTVSNGGTKTVYHGDNVTFSVTRQPGYTQKAPVVKINGTELVVSTVNGDTFNYTISNINGNKTVTIDDQSLNNYKIDYDLGSGASKGSDSASSINHFGTATITIDVDVAYDQSTPAVTVTNGKLSEGTRNGNTYTYTLSEVTADTTVKVDAMNKNTYSAVLPFDKENGTYKVTNADADKETNVVSGIVYGADLTFGIELAEQYNRSKVTVKYNGTIIEPVGGVYTIKNITKDIKESEITVDGVELNHYYITLPLETETGFTIEVGKDENGNLLNAKSVLSGTDFNFKLFLDPAYSKSEPKVKYHSNNMDVNDYVYLTPTDGNVYTIENVLADCYVVVEGVKKNTYTVNFFDANGAILKPYTNVEYGTNLVYQGATPTKASVTISDETVDGVRTVVEKRYEFIGWSQDTSNVTSDMDVHPLFEVKEVTTTYPKDGGTPTVVVISKTKNIIFMNDSGLILHKETVEKGENFEGWREIPEKTSSNPYESFRFLGWDTDRDGKVNIPAGESTAIENVQDDVTFVAVFESSLPSRTVEFYTFDGSELLFTKDFYCGLRVVRELFGQNSIPARSDNKYEYTFEGWAYEIDGDKIDVIDKLVLTEDSAPLKFYAAYSREKITYTYKFVNDGKTLQEGSYNLVDEDQETTIKFNGETPTRPSTKSTDFTFKGWETSNVEGKRYDYIYAATYKETVREYDYTLPVSDGTFTVEADETTGEKIPYGEGLIFTITLDEGYTQTPPVVKSNGEVLVAEKIGENSYNYTIRADGEDAEEIFAKLNDITVETKINTYLVKISGDDGAFINRSAFSTEYNGEDVFVVTLKDSHTQTAPVVKAADGNRVVITLVSNEGNT